MAIYCISFEISSCSGTSFADTLTPGIVKIKDAVQTAAINFFHLFVIMHTSTGKIYWLMFTRLYGLFHFITKSSRWNPPYSIIAPRTLRTSCSVFLHPARAYSSPKGLASRREHASLCRVGATKIAHHPKVMSSQQAICDVRCSRVYKSLA